MREATNERSYVEEVGNPLPVADDGRERAFLVGQNQGTGGVAAMSFAKPERKSSGKSRSCSDAWKASGVGALLSGPRSARRPAPAWPQR